MAYDGPPEQPDGPGTSDPHSSEPTTPEAGQILALAGRVAELERALAAMQRQLAGQPTPYAPAVRASAPSRPAEVAGALPQSYSTQSSSPPPPPMPAAVQSSAPAFNRAAWSGDAQPPAKPRESFELRLGSQIFNRIGIVLVLIATAYGLKLAVDRGLIGPTGRLLVGLFAGAGIVLWSEKFRLKGFAAFSYSLKALGSGILYLTLWAGFQIYHLLPAGAALALMILVTLWNAYMAWAQNSELLAAYALAGGFATPVLLSTGGNHETFLFTYLLAIDLAVVTLVRIRMWPRLLLGAFPLTVLFFIAWYTQSYAPDALTQTTLFILAFACSFASVSVRRTPLDLKGRPPGFARLVTLIEQILLPLANSAFFALAMYSVLQDSGYHSLLPWLMLVLAGLYLGLMRLPQGRTASAIHLSIAVVLLTIAVPLKASGHWITVSWLVEGLALLWVATRLAPAAMPEPAAASEPSEAYASNTLRWLASGALTLGFFGIFVHSFLTEIFSRPPSFFNASTATALIGVLVFAGAAALALRSAPSGIAPSGWTTIATTSFLAIDLIALLLVSRELFGGSSYYPHPPFQTPDFATALVGLAIFAGVVGVTYRFATARPEVTFWRTCAGASTVAFNLIAVLTGVREVGAIWSHPETTVDGALQQALAISAFLMLYGAALLAAGFWRRSAFLRWQALILLVFTILKTFLYDMRNLSQGYRVASALGLGALLMAISFAYQKDWLSMRGVEPSDADKPKPATDPGAAG